ncbi:MAG: type I restriction enzyme HsdR N-terminal domain-containing protein [Kiritimatiellae bacterium]|nr:type I restriction enzyme HsdR N-terminal domain-containing protein [Kiritimatiellia bacterium]
MKITKKTEDRIKAALPKFQKVLGIAKDRDLNESDTVSIITDILAEVFGYDKYLEVTSELAIRGTYCDLAIKLGDKFQYLIECKAIGTDLKEAHLRQAIGYGANKGIQWIILTNGLDWQIYRLRFEQPIAWDLVARFDLSSVSLKNERDMEKLIIVTKEGVEKGAREDLYEKTQCVNRFVAGALILSDAVVSVLKREFRKLADGINVEDAEVVSLLRDGVLRRDLLDGEEAESAMAKVSKHFKQTAKKPAPKKPTPVAAPETPAAPAMSLSDQMLAEAAAETTPVNPPPTEQS